MKPYHPFVFNEEKRIFVGQFEEMYMEEDINNFDSWSQETLTDIDKNITLAILRQYNFYRILDLGCGKGAFTHLLKKKNNQVKGIDLSETAIRKAKSKYPQINFTSGDVTDSELLEGEYDLVVAMEILSYIENWKALINHLSKITSYLYISLFIPENPIGYVKSALEMFDALQESFVYEHKIIDETDQRIFCLCKSKMNSERHELL